MMTTKKEKKAPKVTPAHVKRFCEILDKEGLSCGLGTIPEQREGNPLAAPNMCVEQVWCYVLGLGKGDDPQCVSKEIRKLKICLNDETYWLNDEDRAENMKMLGVAQIGSKGIIDDAEFVSRLAQAWFPRSLPKKLQRKFQKDPSFINAYRLSTMEQGSGHESVLLDLWAKTVDAGTSYEIVPADRSEAIKFIKVVLQVLKDMKAPGIKFLKYVK